MTVVEYETWVMWWMNAIKPNPRYKMRIWDQLPYKLKQQIRHDAGHYVKWINQRGHQYDSSRV